jgi:hypothetical protein
MTSANKSAGEKVISILQSRCWSDSATRMHSEIALALRNNGFFVSREVRALYRGRAGRIDLFAVDDETKGAVAIELDRLTPRVKSAEKLRKFEAFRLIALRASECNQMLDGIDAIVLLAVI